MTEQDVEKTLKTKKVRNIVIGFVAGYVANYIWEEYKLFGYGQTVFKISDEEVMGKYIGQDDLILVGIGVALYYFGYKNYAIGWILAQIVAKAIEMNTPIPTGEG